MSSPTDPQPTDEPAARSQPPTQEIPVVAPAATTTQQLPPHPGATTPAPVRSVQPTGPVGLVPGSPGPLPPPPPPVDPPIASGASAVRAPPAVPEPSADPADSHATTVLQAPGTGAVPPSTPEQPSTAEQPSSAEQPSPSRARVGLDRTALVGVGLVVAALALLELGLSLRFGGESFWSDIPLWSAFATVCTVLGLAGSAALLPGALRLAPATGWRIAAGGLTGLAVFWLLVVLPVVAGDRGFLLTAALGCLGAALWVGPARKG